MSSERAQQISGDTAIHVEGVSKEYRFYDRPSDRLRELVLFNRGRHHTIKRALRDVSFTVAHGEAVGVMGRNGAGKTTLLSILTGTTAPTSGTVDVYGRVGAILGLGVGFLPQYTGRENLRNGLIARGVPPEDLAAKEAEVVEFSELGDEVDNLLRTYSSGMHTRLGFSLAISVDPDILIVDEALAVGDAAFQSKCQRAIRRFMEQGKTLFFVSHNTGILEAVCDRGIVLDRGCVVCDGSIREAIEQVRLRFVGHDPETPSSPGAREWGDPEVGLVRMDMRQARLLGANVYELHQGEWAQLAVTVRTPAPVERPTLGVIMRNALGKEVCGYSTVNSSVAVPRIDVGEFSFEARIPLNVPPGMYTFRVSIADRVIEPPRLVHVWEDVCAVRVRSVGYTVRGMVDPGIEIVYGTEVYSLRLENERRRGARPSGG
ncbi:MAG: ABC transporter ATP-binding protein [Verrucomicrobia bacterium]|nr:ABC transporter ATP-binding protein [Verrucomicrobiota bacterium]